MLKEDVINKKDYDSKMTLISTNIHLIEEAIDDPQKMKELEANLGIVNESLKEVILMSDLSKVNPLEEQKKKEREARLLVKKLNEDRRIREKNKMIKYEELKQKKLQDEKE